MFEEDRQTAIAMYEKMFEMAQNDDALISYLSSPTRQAVLIARSYDAKDRKLSAHAELGNDSALVSNGEQAKFIETIRDIFSEVIDEIPTIIDSGEEEEFPAAAGVNETPVNRQEDIKWVKETTPFENARTAEPSKPKSEEVVDAFINDLSINMGDLSQTKPTEKIEYNNSAAASNQTEVNLYKTAPTEDVSVTANTVQPESVPVQTNEVRQPYAEQQMQAPEEQKLSGASLVLFLMIAIPLTAIGLVAILSVTAGLLAASGATLLMAFRTFQAAFGSFKVFADLLVVAGTALCMTSLGLLLLWTGLYVLIGVTAKMINGIINVAVKVCGK